VALPLTEWLDHTLFSKVGDKKKRVAPGRQQPAV